MRKSHGNPIILLAEDSDDDIRLLRRAIKKARLQTVVQVVEDGEQVLAYLKGEGLYSNRDEYPLPDLLLLDLKMPRMDGFQVLQWLRQSDFKGLPVVVLTQSSQIRDVNEAYRFGANSFLTKPVIFQEFVGMLESLQDFWLNRNRGPAISRPQAQRRESKPAEE